MTIKSGTMGFEQLKTACRGLVKGAQGSKDALERIASKISFEDGASVSASIVETTGEILILTRPVAGAKCLTFKCQR